MSTTRGPITYVAFGDSITVGAKASRPERRWVDVFAALVAEWSGREIQVHNAGVGDNTISPRTRNYEHASHPAAALRLDADVIERRPDLITVAFGLNDMRFGTDVQVFAEDLSAVLRRIRAGAPGATALCLNVFHMTAFASFPPRDRRSRGATDAYNEVIAQVARQAEMPLCDVATALNRNDALVHTDGVHVGDLGHRLIAHRVFETLASGTGFLAG